MKPKIFFVVLHYQNIKETINCVNSILELKHSDMVNVVIVDNCSINGSGEKLKKKFENLNNVHLIITEKNGGFAYGNNIGYLFAKDKMADYIIVTNNDTIFFDNYFIDKLINNKHDAELIAPDIINVDGFHQNPVRETYSSIRSCRKLILKNNVKNILLSLPYFNRFIMKKLQIHEAEWYRKYYVNKKLSIINKNFVLYGAAVIYTKKWIEKEDIAFIPITFMYCEEDTLTYYCSKKGYSICYDNSLKLTHLEGKSVAESSNGDINKTINRNKMINKSLKKYIKYITEEKIE